MLTGGSVTHPSEDLMQLVLHEMRIAPITNITISQQTSQIILTLGGDQQAVFAPNQCTDINRESKEVVGGGEIVAFHLDRVLKMFGGLPVVGRVVDVPGELLNVVSSQHVREMFVKNGSHWCVRQCRNCDNVCGTGSTMQGSLTLVLPQEFHLSKEPRPWLGTQDEYRQRKLCENFENPQLLLDFADTSIFDYLIQNTKRKYYHYISTYPNQERRLHIDNVKCLVDTEKDERPILAPLYQCCRVRKRTYNILTLDLNHSQKSSLSDVLTRHLRMEPLSPMLSTNYLRAIDRRHRNILLEIEKCSLMRGKNNVLN